MKEKRIIESNIEPQNPNVLWLDGDNNIKNYNKGKWVSTKETLENKVNTLVTKVDSTSPIIIETYNQGYFLPNDKPYVSDYKVGPISDIDKQRLLNLDANSIIIKYTAHFINSDQKIDKKEGILISNIFIQASEIQRDEKTNKITSVTYIGIDYINNLFIRIQVYLSYVINHYEVFVGCYIENDGMIKSYNDIIGSIASKYVVAQLTLYVGNKGDRETIQDGDRITFENSFTGKDLYLGKDYNNILDNLHIVRCYKITSYDDYKGEVIVTYQGGNTITVFDPTDGKSYAFNLVDKDRMYEYTAPEE